jgi:hypothetical protein
MYVSTLSIRRALMRTLHWAANAKDALLVARILTRQGIMADLILAHCPEEFLEELHCADVFDLILIDASAGIQTKTYTTLSRTRFPEASIILYGDEFEDGCAARVNGPLTHMVLSKEELWRLPFVLRHLGSRASRP